MLPLALLVPLPLLPQFESCCWLPGAPLLPLPLMRGAVLLPLPAAAAAVGVPAAAPEVPLDIEMLLMLLIKSCWQPGIAKGSTAPPPPAAAAA